MNDDDTLTPDPRFPNRPTHPDLARLSSAAAEQDAIADMLGINEAAKVDLPSFAYIAQNRILMMFNDGSPLTVELSVKILSLYLDAFHLGVGFAKRGGHRPANTGNTGDKESSS